MPTDFTLIEALSYDISNRDVFIETKFGSTDRSYLQVRSLPELGIRNLLY